MRDRSPGRGSVARSLVPDVYIVLGTNSRKCVLCLRVRCFVELSADVYINSSRSSPSTASSSRQVRVALGLPVSPTRAASGIVHASRVVEASMISIPSPLPNTAVGMAPGGSLILPAGTIRPEDKALLAPTTAHLHSTVVACHHLPQGYKKPHPQHDPLRREWDGNH